MVETGGTTEGAGGTTGAAVTPVGIPAADIDLVMSKVGVTGVIPGVAPGVLNIIDFEAAGLNAWFAENGFEPEPAKFAASSATFVMAVWAALAPDAPALAPAAAPIELKPPARPAPP